jgi:hypothetical protein
VVVKVGVNWDSIAKACIYMHKTKAGMKGSVGIITYVKETRLCKTSLKPRCFQVKILTGKLVEEQLGVKLIMKIAFCYLHTSVNIHIHMYEVQMLKQIVLKI